MRRPVLPPAVTRTLQELLAFSRFLARRFNDDQCFEAAGALSFTTVFAMVPLLTVALSMFASFQEFSHFSEAITSFVFRHFVPTSGEEIEFFIRQFVDKASHLTAVGTIALIISGLLLMTSIEHSFNRIWRLVSPRRALPQFIVFWTAMTLGPLLVGAGLAVSSAMLASPYLARLSEQLGLEAMVIGAMPFMVTFAAATLAYLIVPNCPVRLRHAVIGGLFTASAFTMAKYGFALFVGQFASYQQIYGAVAFIPVFLLWIYISWVVVLLGASLTAALGAYSHESRKRKLPERERFPALLRMLGRLREAQVEGVGLSVGELASRLSDVPESTIAELLGLLERERIAQRTDIGSWILSRDPEFVRISALYRADAFLLPLSDGKHAAPVVDLDSRVEQMCENAAEAAEHHFDVALAELFRKPPNRSAEQKNESP
jgi:membrane protein